MKKQLLTLIFMMILLISPLFMELASAQPPPPPPQDIPLDGGLTLLIASGIAYGVRKLYKGQKAENE